MDSWKQLINFNNRKRVQCAFKYNYYYLVKLKFTDFCEIIYFFLVDLKFFLYFFSL
ncbi:hypothetical protein RhiirB3_114092 [Rhizophagus irregularis]|nr:hypothetical protein RhiirB3_114092 [Rhizophagus irregularis]